jgi:hypothetical protein
VRCHAGDRKVAKDLDASLREEEQRVNPAVADQKAEKKLPSPASEQESTDAIKKLTQICQALADEIDRLKRAVVNAQTAADTAAAAAQAADGKAVAANAAAGTADAKAVAADAKAVGANAAAGAANAAAVAADAKAIAAGQI